MNTYIELVLYGTICFFPFMLIAYYPLRYFKRFSMKTTFLLELAFALFEIAFFTLALNDFLDYEYIAIALIVLFNVFAYRLLYTLPLGRILFNLLLIVNIANFTIIFAELLELLFFPQSADILFHWTISVCVLITEIAFVLPVFLYIKHYSDSMIRNSDYDYIWQVAWLIPLLLSCLGLAFIYTPSIYADTKCGLYIKKSILCAIILICMLLTYSFIAKLIRTQHNVLMLKNDLYHQSVQKMQLQRIETKIQDTRVLRHDLRHHVRLMCNYVDQEDYDSLKDYLHQYSASIQHISQLHYTNNTLINTLLVYYADLCRSCHMEFDVKTALPDTLPLQDNEITILTSNLLENAYQACNEMDESLSRFIRVYAACKTEACLLIILENSFHNQTKQDSCGNFLTTKPDGNGLGLLSVKEIVEKYNGYMKIDTNDNTFSVSISIPLK